MAVLRRKSRLPNPTTLESVANIQYKMNRRLSIMRRASLAPSSRTDGDHSVQPLVKLENTYRLAPQEHERFNAPKVQKATTAILESFLSGEEYDAAKCARLTQQLCEVIKVRVREMNMPRYKIVCYVLIGQDCGQSINNSSRCVWNTETDNFATATYKNGSLFAAASVYGLYFE